MNSGSPVLALASELIKRKSVTPEDGGCQDLLAAFLETHDFDCRRINLGDTKNLWARRGKEDPLFVFAGHTDVVPSGPYDRWHSPPFEPTVKDGRLYGRGAADMKGSLAAMVLGASDFVGSHPDHKGSIAFLITSDEEGTGENGTAPVVEMLKAEGTIPQYCLVGEPSSVSHLGDTIKNGRRGSLTGHLIVRGMQGHIAYPHLARNPIHLFAPALADLTQLQFDRGNEYFQPTSFQISNINAGTGAENVIPGELEVLFNFRFSPEVTAQVLEEKVRAVLDHHDLQYGLTFRLSGNPFLTPVGKLVQATRKAVHDVVGTKAQLSTSGGTSDGRFLATTGAEVIELGPINDTIHKINEFVSVEDLDNLAVIYREILVNLLTERIE